MKPTTAALAVLMSATAPGLVRAAPELGLPIDCDIGKTCFVQQYVDLDPGPGVVDYMCGEASYDGHKGTDFRVPTTKDVGRGVPVIAAAPGTVRGKRDGMDDRLVRSDADRAAVEKRECGNGVVIDHGDGWETQYCHLRKGSVTVGTGAAVEKGQKLGEVGYSGQAAFAHVHLSVRHQGKVVDPFRGVGIEACGLGPDPLWEASALDALNYAPTQIVGFGLAGGAVRIAEAETGALADFAPDRQSPALVGWGLAINLKTGDALKVSLAGPKGSLAENDMRMKKRRAVQLAFSGRKRPRGGWPPGTYLVEAKVERDGSVIAQAERRFEVE